MSDQPADTTQGDAPAPQDPQPPVAEGASVKEALAAGAGSSGPGEPTPPGGVPRSFGGDDDLLDIARGDVTDEDLDGLEAAIDSLDFATRKATPERQARLAALIARVQDVADQIKQGVRRAPAEAQPLSAEQQARYQALVDEGVTAGEKGDLDLARRKLEEAVRLSSDGVQGLFNLGVVYGLVAHREISKAEFYDNYVRDEVYVGKARRCYDHVLELEPQHLPSLKNLATLYAMRDERDVAAAYLRRLLEIAPRDDGERDLVAEARQQLSELGSV